MSGATGRYEAIQVGDKASFSKTISESDVYGYAGITGDFNPVHIDQEAAAASAFKTRVAHGMISAGLISTVLGTKLPGPGTIYLGQELSFKAPVFFGDTVTAECTVIEKRDDKKILRLETAVKNQRGEVVLTGVATVMQKT
ncbi:MAG: MaoC family dehydratase [Myxococcota bacterium]|nr:MaoC family dehydratase [Myxococcota bacterium]